MRRFLFIAALSFASLAQAQTHRFPHIDVVNAAPSGSCSPSTNANILEQYFGDIYTCDPNTLVWRKLTGNSTGLPGGTSGQIQYNGSNTFQGAAQLDSNGNLGASVNTQINVMMYGAKGDCSTDDHNAIAAAQTAALSFTPPAAIYFPKPPGGCYVTSTIQWAGVSLLGQPQGQGNAAGVTPNSFGVTLKGKPGQDVLHVPDPLSTTFTWNQTWSIRDMTFWTDGTSGSAFPHRWPGRWFDDTGTTNGSPIITSQNGEFHCGDIGQAIQINGAGSAGANLVTTIANVAPCWAVPGNAWQVITLAANAQATLTNAHTYVSLLGLPVTATIGNCGIAFDMQDGNPADWTSPSQKYGNLGDEIKNVTFISFGQTTNPCSFYTQGGWGPYQFTAEQVNSEYGQYGVVQGTAEINANFQSSGNDYQKWDHNWFFNDAYPWISYNGGFNSISNWQLTTKAGPQILGVGNIENDAVNGWTVNIPEFEPASGATTYGMRFAGNESVFVNTTFGGLTAVFDGSSNRCVHCNLSGTLNLGGYGNDIYNDGPNALTLTDLGRGNHFSGNNSSSPYKGMPAVYPQSPTPYKGESQVVGRITADAISDGNASVLYNRNDLFIWPQDMVITPFAGAVYANYFITDSASPSGAEWSFNNTRAVDVFTQFPYLSTTEQLIVGTNLPAKKATVYYSAKCPVSITSLTFSVRANGSAFANDTETCNTTLQTYSFIVDFSGKSGQFIGFQGGTANAVLIAWVALRPFVNDVNGKTLPGAGVAIATGPATSTLHDCAWFADTAGTIGDSGAACAQSVCAFTQALSTSSIAPGGWTSTTSTCTGALTTDVVKCSPASATPTFHGITGYDPTINSGNVLTIDPPYVSSSNTVTIGVGSSVLNSLTFSPGAMSLHCQVVR